MTDISTLSRSLNAVFGEAKEVDGPQEMVDIDQIHVREQARTEFEDATQTLADLGASLLKRWAQPVVLTPRQEGGYWLVAGERRIRAARLVGINPVPSRIFDLTDEEADELQQAENIHRKNLTQTEEARKVQRDLDALKGDRKALIAKYQKNGAWVSKTLALLDLGPEASVLVRENLSSDKEVIGMVRSIEKVDPKAAAAAVKDIRDNKGSARVIAEKAKDAVKPPSKEKLERRASKQGTESMAMPKDRSNEDGGPVSLFSSFGSQDLGSQEAVLPDNAQRKPKQPTPAQALEDMSDVEIDAMTKRLKVFHGRGRLANSENPLQAVFDGIRSGEFSTQGEGALKLAAFLQGAFLRLNFDLQECIKSVK